MGIVTVVLLVVFRLCKKRIRFLFCEFGNFVMVVYCISLNVLFLGSGLFALFRIQCTL